MEWWQLSIKSLAVYIAPDQTLLGLSADGTPRSWADLDWVDVSDDVRVPLTVFRGKMDERVDIQPSRAKVILNNVHGLYDNDNSDSPYYGKLQPYTPILIVWNEACPFVDGVERGVMLGTTGEDWPVPRQTEDDSWVELDCLDLLALLARCKVSAYLPEQVFWERLEALLDLGIWPPASGSPPYHRILYGDPGGSRCAPTEMAQQSVLDGIMLAMRTEGIYRVVAGIDRDGNLAAAGRYEPFEAPFSEIQATFGNTEGAIGCADPKIGSRGKNLYTQTRVEFLERGATTVRVKTGAATFLGDSVITMAPLEEGGDAVLEGDIPAGAYLDFGTAKVVRLAQNATAGDAAIFVNPLDAQDIPEGATATYQSNVAISVGSGGNAAQLRYGKTELAFTGLLLRNRSEAQAMADDALIDYVAPRSRVDMIPLSGITNAEQSEQCVMLGVGELVRFEHKPRYASAAWGVNLRIHGIEYTFGAGFCDVKLYVAPANLDRDEWNLGAEEDDNPANSLIGATDSDPAGEAILGF